MKYLAVLLTFPSAIYLFSFARYQWKTNKPGSTGSVLLAAVSVIFPALVLFFRN